VPSVASLRFSVSLQAVLLSTSEPHFSFLFFKEDNGKKLARTLQAELSISSKLTEERSLHN